MCDAVPTSVNTSFQHEMRDMDQKMRTSEH